MSVVCSFVFLFVYLYACIYMYVYAHREFFGKELNDHIDPDVTVAYGAASILD